MEYLFAFLRASTSRKRLLPQEWREYVHPEGQSYFVHTRYTAPRINVITDAYIYDSNLRRVVSEFSEKVVNRVNSERWYIDAASIELLVEVEVDRISCSYYFVDHKDSLIFWLDNINTEELDMPIVSGLDHLRESFKLRLRA